MKVITALVMLFTSALVFASEPVWLDVRSEGEFNSGHLDAATNVPHGEITAKISALVEDKDTPIYLYCRSGNRAGIAQKALEAEGYTNITNVGGLSDAREKYAAMTE
tara:strand:- start:14 stop:334 length:321 start_codon:yes stop_codon:yes gene_type:complete